MRVTTITCFLLYAIPELMKHACGSFHLLANIYIQGGYWLHMVNITLPFLIAWCSNAVLSFGMPATQ